MGLENLRPTINSALDSLRIAGFNATNRKGLHIDVLSRNGNGVNELAASKQSKQLGAYYKTHGTTRSGNFYDLRSQKLSEDDINRVDTLVGKLRRIDGELKKIVNSIPKSKPIGSERFTNIGIIYSSKGK